MSNTKGLQRSGESDGTRKLGNMFGATGGNYAGNVYGITGVAPTINTAQGGYRMPIIVCAMRGRYNEDGSISQNLELIDDNCSHTITTVQKDCLIIEVNND